MRSFLAPLLALAVLAPVAVAQTAERSDFIVAVQSLDGEPVVGATVRVGGGQEATTGPDGAATVEGLRAGQYPVGVSLDDEVAQAVLAVLEGPGPWSLSVRLGAGPAAGPDGHGRDLAGSPLAASDFFARQGDAAGTILDATDFDASSALRLGPLVRGAVPGVRLRDTRHGQALVPLRGFCRMSVFLDGAPSLGLTQDLQSLRPEGVALVEVYPHVGHLPPAYRRGDYPWGTTCGVVLVWTEAGLAARS